MNLQIFRFMIFFSKTIESADKLNIINSFKDGTN